MIKDIPISVVIHKPILLNCYQFWPSPYFFVTSKETQLSKQLDELMTNFVQFIIAEPSIK